MSASRSATQTTRIYLSARWLIRWEMGDSAVPTIPGRDARNVEQDGSMAITFGEASRHNKSGSLNSCTSPATGAMQMTRLEKPSVENLTTIFRFCKVSLGNCRALVVEKEKTERKKSEKISPSSPSGPKRIRRLFFWLDSLFLFSLFCNDIRASLTASIDSHKSCFLGLSSAFFAAFWQGDDVGFHWLSWDDGTGGRW